MRIAAWNVNSLRLRLPLVLEYINKHKVDVLLLQETKCTDDQFPRFELQSAGLHAVFMGQKSYNGVAILSRFAISDVTYGLPHKPEWTDARHIEATINGVRVVSVYIPNGRVPNSEYFAHKLAYYTALTERVQTLQKNAVPLVVGGDFNVANSARDVFDPKGMEGQLLFHPDERAAFRRLLSDGGLDDVWRIMHPTLTGYSWWDYRDGSFVQNKGLRIDYMLTSPSATDRITAAGIETEPHGATQPSDHTPVWVHMTT